MKKLTFCCLLAMLCTYANGYGQTKQMHIGDEVPPMRFTNVLNHNGPALQLPSGNGRAIILDFFATWCGGCIHELPRLSALKDSMKGKVEIWLVSREPKEKLQGFLEKRAVAKAFPIVYGDSILNSLFPNRLLPHDVWIDTKGTVAAITYAECISLQNLTKLASGQVMNLPVKRDITGHTDAKPLLESTVLEAVLWKSTLTRNIDGAGHVVGFRKAEDKSRLYEINQSPIKLYTSAWLWPINRIVLRVKNPYAMVADRINPETWSRKYAYTYELIGPPLPPEVFRRRMRVDLDMGLGYISSPDSAFLPVWSISRSNQKINNKATIDKPVIVRDDEQKLTCLKNQTIGSIVSWLNRHHSRQYEGLHFDSIDSSNELYSLQVHDSVMYNKDALEKLLTASGLAIERSFEKMAVLVISDAIK